MGCTTSAPVHPSPRPIPRSPSIRDRPPPPCDPPAPSVEPSDILKSSTKSLLKAISKAPQPPDLVPIVCLSNNAIPLVVCPLCLENGDRTDISLPTVALGLSTQGRLLYVGNPTFLIRCTGAHSDYSTFLEQITQFLAGESLEPVRILLLGFSPMIAEILQENLSAFTFQSDVNDVVDDPSKYKVIITTIEFSKVRTIKEFLDLNGGVIVCGDPDGLPLSRQWRRLLCDYGMGIPNCSLVVGDLSKDFVRLRSSFVLLEQFRFSAFCNTFKREVEETKPIDLCSLDTVVTQLRYHITGMLAGPNEKLEELWNLAWSFMDTTGGVFREENTIRPQAYHVIVALLLSEVMTKLAPSQYDGIDRSFPFPGRAVVPLANFQLQAEFASGGWYSTGLYLPPGVIGTVVVDRRVSQCWVQVGSHIEFVCSKTLAWKRWPSVTTRFEILDRPIQIASPFGGIIYLASEDIRAEANLAFVVTFCHVGRYPFFSIHETSSWEETKDLDAPWAELETRFIIFTVPSAFLRSIPDLTRTADRIDVIVHQLLKFTSDDNAYPYRVVFDVIVTDSMLEDDTIVMPIEMMEDILVNEGPSVALLTLFQLIAERSIPPLGFPTNARSALASLATYSAAETVWSMDDFRGMLRAKSPLFPPMVQVYAKCDKAAFPTAFGDIRAKMQGRANRQYFLYKLFVKRLTMLTGAGHACNFLLDTSNVTSIAKVGFVLGPSVSLAEYQMQFIDHVTTSAG